MQIRFKNGIVVEFPKGTPISTINTVERAIVLPKPERDRVLRKYKAKLTTDNFVEVKDFQAFRKEMRKGVESVTKMEGPQGEKGEDGISIQGEKGDKGDKGRDGLDGLDGLNGKNGKDGKNGVDGKDGEDGSPDTPEQVRNKLSTLKEEERLDVKHIKGVKDLAKSMTETTTLIQGGVASNHDFYVDSVKVEKGNEDLNLIAGANVTITAEKGTDDTNRSMNYTISSSGGGGGHTISESDVDLTQRTNLDFSGGQFTVTDDAGNDSTDVTLADTAVTPGSYTTADITVDAKGRVTAASSGSSASDLGDLGDVTLTAPADNEVLAYDNGSGDWINQTPSEAGLTQDLQDVTDEGATTTNTITLNPSGNNEGLIANGSGSGTAIDIDHAGGGTKLNIETTGAGDLIDAGAFNVDNSGNVTGNNLSGTNTGDEDTASITALGALMDSELTSITDVKALDQSVASGASPTFDGANITGIDADNVDIADAGGIITATDVEGALQENRTAIDLNTAKVTNATHTGEVTGSGALTVDSTAITNKTEVTADNADHVLISDASDSGNLKKVLVSDFSGGSLPGSIDGDDDHLRIDTTAVSGQSPYSAMNVGATTNLCTNPKFETDLTSWSDTGTGITSSRDTGEAWIGSASAKLVTTANSSGIRYSFTPNQNSYYIVSCRVKGASGGEGAKITIDTDTQSASSTYFVNSTYSSEDNVTDDWRVFKLGFATNGTATSMTVDITSSVAASQTIYVDGVQIEEKANGSIDDQPTPYCDGDMGIGHAWTSTANASTSTRAAGFYFLAPVDTESEGTWVQRKDGTIEGPIVWRADTMNGGGYIDEHFPFEFQGDVQDNVGGTGVRHGVVRVRNNGEGPALYVQSDTTRRYAMVIDGGSITSGSVLAVFAPADLATMKSSGGKFLEFADKDGNSPYQFAPGFQENGVVSQSFVDRYTWYGSGGQTTTDRALSGTVSVTNASKTVTGSGTSFLTDFKPGDYFAYNNAGATYQDRTVDSIASHTSLTLVTNASHTVSGKAYKGKERQHKPAVFQLEGNYADHANTAVADHFYNIYPSGSTGQLHVMKGSARDDKSTPSAEGDGDPLVTGKYIDNSTTSISASAAETTVMSGYTVPARQLTDGKVLRINFFGDMDALAATSTVIFRVKLGGTTILQSNAQEAEIASVVDFKGTIEIVGTSDTAQKSMIDVHGKGTSGASVTAFMATEIGSSSVDMRVDRALTVTADFSDGSSMNLENWYAELI